MLIGPLYCAEFGNPERETLVLLHGGGASRWVWNAVAAELMDEFHLLVPDLLEHGLSGGQFSIHRNAELVAELIGLRANGGKAHVVGLSIGAQIGLELLADFSHSLSSAFLCGPSTEPVPALAWFCQPRFEWLARRVAQNYMRVRTVRPVIWANERLLHLPPQFRAEFVQDVEHLTLEGFMRMVRGFLEYRFHPNLRQVQTPVLLCVGGLDPPFVKASVNHLVNTLPGARAVKAPNLPHNWNLQRPELFARTIRTWIYKQAWPAELEER